MIRTTQNHADQTHDGIKGHELHKALTFPNPVKFIVMFLAVIRYGVHGGGVRVLPLRLGIEAPDHARRTDSCSPSGFFQPQHPSRDHQHVCSASHVTLSSTTEGSLNSVSQLVNDPSDVAFFLHTSRTMSRPKGVPLTQLNLAFSVQNIKSVYKLTESDSTVIILPLFHVHGLIAGLLSSFSTGAAATLPAAISLALRLLLVMKGDEGFKVMAVGI